MFIIACLIVIRLAFGLVQAQRVEVMKRDRFHCKGGNCLASWDRGYMIEIHHIMPIKWGGSDSQDNLISLCRPCHKQAHIAIGDFESARLIQDRIDEKGTKRYGYY